jgi:hypothetical protein
MAERLAAATQYRRGFERRLLATFNPRVGRWRCCDVVGGARVRVGSPKSNPFLCSA